MDPVVDPSVVDALFDAAGVSNYRNAQDLTIFASAAGFCVGAELVRLSIFTPPQGPRDASGPARWIVITDKRAIEVVGEMSGDWWSRRPIQFAVSGELTVSVRPLATFKELRFTGNRWMWHPEAADSAREWLRGTAAVLRPVDGSEDLILWEDFADNGAGAPKAGNLLDGLRWLATRIPTFGEGA